MSGDDAVASALAGHQVVTGGTHEYRPYARAAAEIPQLQRPVVRARDDFGVRHETDGHDLVGVSSERELQSKVCGGPVATRKVRAGRD